MERIQTDRRGERGITILLVAAAMIGVLAMAALAVDIVALYFAKAEAQRAADATALAAAKMFAFSGYTSNSSTFSPISQLCVNGGAGGGGAVNKAAESTLAQNVISGQAATLTAIACDFTQAENPLVTVTVQQTGLPSLFGRIWGAGAGSVSATAKAEAFNPAGGSTNIAVGAVKPWLIPNCLDSACASGPQFFTSSYGIANTGSFIGQSWSFARQDPTVSSPATLPTGPPAMSPPNWGFYALRPPPPTYSCPSASALSCSALGTGGPGANYRDNISCDNMAVQYSCGQQLGPSQTVIFSPIGGGSLAPRTIEGITCMIHASSAGTANSGQDTISAGSLPTIITGGYNNPDAALQGVVNISRSDSVVTVPVYSGGNACPVSASTCSAQVIGFLQLGVQDVQSGGHIFDAVIMNAAPCNPANTGTAVAGGAVSPVPVRLITPP